MVSAADMQNLPRLQQSQEVLPVVITTTAVMPSKEFVPTRVEVQITKLK
jgi:hypothetical protein